MISHEGINHPPQANISTLRSTVTTTEGPPAVTSPSEAWFGRDELDRTHANQLAMETLRNELTELLCGHNFDDDTDYDPDSRYEGEPCTWGTYRRYERHRDIYVDLRWIHMQTDSADNVTRILTVTSWKKQLYGEKPCEVKPFVLYSGRIEARMGKTKYTPEFLFLLLDSLL